MKIKVRVHYRYEDRFVDLTIWGLASLDAMFPDPMTIERIEVLGLAD